MENHELRKVMFFFINGMLMLNLYSRNQSELKKEKKRKETYTWGR